MRETWVRSLGREFPLEKEMATHSSTLTWKIPWTEEPGRLQSMGSQRLRHDWATLLHFIYVYIYDFVYAFIFGRAGSSLLHTCFLQLWYAGFSLWGLLLLWRTGPGLPGLRSLRFALRFARQVSTVAAHRLSCSPVHGILPAQGLNLRLLPWQADSYPLSHQRSPNSRVSMHDSYTEKKKEKGINRWFKWMSE